MGTPYLHITNLTGHQQIFHDLGNLELRPGETKQLQLSPRVLAALSNGQLKNYCMEGWVRLENIPANGNVPHIVCGSSWFTTMNFGERAWHSSSETAASFGFRVLLSHRA